MMLLRIGLVLAGLVAVTERAAAESAHAFSFPSLDGGTLALSAFAGQPVLVANTASLCGFTPQYEALQALHDRYADLVVVGLPSDDFGGQEYSSAAEVAQFCEVNYGITFPMSDILHVRGPAADPFWQWAAAQGVRPSWNFHKLLIGADGALLADFPTGTRPDAPAVLRAIEDALAGR